MATITINTPGAQDARIAAAIGTKLGLRDANNALRSATAAEVKGFLVDYLRQSVLETETAVARATAEAGVTPITPT